MIGGLAGRLLRALEPLGRALRFCFFATEKDDDDAIEFSPLATRPAPFSPPAARPAVAVSRPSPRRPARAEGDVDGPRLTRL